MRVLDKQIGQEIDREILGPTVAELGGLVSPGRPELEEWRARLEAHEGEATSLAFDEPGSGCTDELRLKIFRSGSPLSLSQMLPILSSMDVEIIDEHPYALQGLPHPAYVYDFGLRFPRPVSAIGRDLFERAVMAVWEGHNEADPFNALVLRVGLTWRQVTLLRACASYLNQVGTPFGQASIAEALTANPLLTGLLVELFEARFTPTTAHAARVAACTELGERIDHALEEVPSLDHDRILRSYRAVIEATVRTNYFQEEAGESRSALCLKLLPGEIPGMPEPRPKFEIFVHSPRVEGVHLRFGAVARGGLRWSDRRDDYRSEVLGLVKAQMVKNTVIVPVGAKGGFFCKQLPPQDPAQPPDRDAWMAEGVACYRIFISALLDVTDNLVDGVVVPPAQVVRHDGDDPYLVVAADKGTATFSDLANEVSREHGFWLGDAFASGGSVGYDHKAMGITARGAWVSVRRHFRELGMDCQTQDFTCVGIGDMSGDVFGNGMLSSDHLRLVAAFDHRHIFLDPQPDAASSYAERRRLFELPRSSWADYDRGLISAGGGVHSRTAKSVPISEEVRRALAIADRDGRPVTALTPDELITAILLAPVDLLWNGGIGTYVKAASETHADVADKACDGIRVNGGELRVRCIGEGGNLGLTQRGRIEYAANGGRINTDFIDNSAGVDTSDREVNIKILLDGATADGRLGAGERGALLASMTDEVAELVLRDNDDQNIALSMSAAESVRQVPVHADWIERLERDHGLHRELEVLPDAKELARRAEAGTGLTQPELAVLLAHTKIALADELLGTDLPDDPYLESRLLDYFPEPIRRRHRAQVLTHPLRREIIVTQVVNELLNGTGTTYYHRLSEETQASAADLLRAAFVAREIFGTAEVLTAIRALDDVLPAQVQTQMRTEIRDLVERAARWLTYNRPRPLDLSGTLQALRTPTRSVVAALPEVFVGQEREAFELRRDELTGRGVPEPLAARVAALAPAYTVLTIVSVAREHDTDPVETARLHFALGDRLGLPAFGSLIRALPRDDRWQTIVRADLREELHAAHGRLTGQALSGTPTESSDVPARVAQWQDGRGKAVESVLGTLREICAQTVPDLAALSVGMRAVRSLS